MRRRIGMWAGIGFLVSCCWVLYTFVAPPDRLMATMRGTAAEALLLVSCPIVSALRGLPLRFRFVPLINAAPYAALGLAVEVLLRRPNPHS